MRITLYLFHNVIPKRDPPILKRCDKCNRALFKYNADELTMTNSMGGWDSYLPETKWIEIQCHSCGTKYNLMFQ